MFYKWIVVFIVLAAHFAACASGVCTRHSDCSEMMICSAAGRCVLQEHAESDASNDDSDGGAVGQTDASTTQIEDRPDSGASAAASEPNGNMATEVKSRGE